jgi:hypothetical protein
MHRSFHQLVTQLVPRLQLSPGPHFRCASELAVKRLGRGEESIHGGADAVTYSYSFAEEAVAVYKRGGCLD